MNKQFAQGHLASAATINTVKEGREALNFTIACNDGKDADGKDYVEYIPVVAYGKTGFASKLVEYLGKGAAVTAAGKLVYSKSEKDNAVYTNARIEVNSLYDIRLNGSGTGKAGAEAQATETPAEAAQQSEGAVTASLESPAANVDTSFDDDIPF